MSSEGDLARILAKLGSADPDLTVSASWLAPYLLEMAEGAEPGTYDHMINPLFNPRVVILPTRIPTPIGLINIQINTQNLNIIEVKELFNLQEDPVPWTLGEESYQVPNWLRKCMPV